MKKILLKKFLIVALGLIILSGLLFFIFKTEKPIKVQSGLSENIRGWIWSQSDGSYPGGIGWISLNCLNDYDGDGEAENCCSGGNNCPHQVANANYGVKLENNKIIGYGWSPNIGWICFGETCDQIAPDGKPSWACLGCYLETETGIECRGEPDGGEGFCNNNNLISHWKMNNNWNDSSGNNNGFPQGEPIFKGGRFKKAGFFDGVNDYVYVNDDDSLDFTENDSFTLSAWIKTDDNDGGIILRKMGNSGYSFEVTSDKKLKCFIKSGSNTLEVESNNSVVDNRWHHVVCLLNRAKEVLQIYLDGQLNGSIGGSIGDLSNNSNLTFAGNSLYLSGYLDNISIFKRAKTPEEIWGDSRSEISGWAKVMWENESNMWENRPNDGWIKLKGKTINEEIYGLSLGDFSTHYELQGFAWTISYDPYINNAGIGWLGAGFGYCLNQTPGSFEILSIGSQAKTITLNWSPSTCASEYGIWRCQVSQGETCQPNQEIDRLYSSNCCSYFSECSYTDTDENLTEGERYCYKIRAYQKDNYRDSNNIRCLTLLTPPSPPPSAVDGSICGLMKIKWQVVSGATGYNLYRSLEENGCYLGNEQTCRKIADHLSCHEISCDGNQCCDYEDKQIVAKAKYYYWVSAISNEQESSLSYLGNGESICLPPTKWQEK